MKLVIIIEDIADERITVVCHGNGPPDYTSHALAVAQAVCEFIEGLHPAHSFLSNNFPGAVDETSHRN